MLRYIYSDQLNQFPKLQKSMYCDRAWQFRQRLGWQVSVDDGGAERDEYDDLNPLYVIWEHPDGTHGGSMRAMPTSGRCMINEHFRSVSGQTFNDPNIWESTRFCLSPNLGSDSARISAALMLAGCEIGLGFALNSAVGIFDPRMIRIYRRLGWPPKVLGHTGKGRDKIYAGQWGFSDNLADRLAYNAGISRSVSKLWFARTFTPQDRVAA